MPTTHISGLGTEPLKSSDQSSVHPSYDMGALLHAEVESCACIADGAAKQRAIRSASLFMIRIGELIGMRIIV